MAGEIPAESAGRLSGSWETEQRRVQEEVKTTAEIDRPSKMSATPHQVDSIIVKY